MAAISPLITTVLPGLGGSTVYRAYSIANGLSQAAHQQSGLADRQALSLQQLYDQQALDTANRFAGIGNRMDQTVAVANQNEQARRDALRQAMARSTVNLAGQGIDPTDGSGEAILLGQVSSSDQQRQADDQATQLRLQALRQEANAINQQNLLADQQLIERQRLQWLSQFG